MPARSFRGTLASRGDVGLARPDELEARASSDLMTVDERGTIKRWRTADCRLRSLVDGRHPPVGEEPFHARCCGAGVVRGAHCRHWLPRSCRVAASSSRAAARHCQSSFSHVEDETGVVQR